MERARQLFVDAKRVRDAIDREGEAAIETMKLSDLKQVLDKANELKFPHRSPVIEKIIEYLYKTSKDQFVKMLAKLAKLDEETEKVLEELSKTAKRKDRKLKAAKKKKKKKKAGNEGSVKGEAKDGVN